MGRLETNRRSKISLDCSFKSRLCQQKICQYGSLLDFYVLGVYVGWTTSPGMTSSCRGATGTFSWSWTELTLPGNVQVQYSTVYPYIRIVTGPAEPVPTVGGSGSPICVIHYY